VVSGLFVTIFLWRNGPLGVFRTPSIRRPAMVIAQGGYCTPIVWGITVAAIQHLPRNSGSILALAAQRMQY